MSNSEFIDSEVIKGLIITNFFDMIGRKNIAELEEFRNNFKRCRQLLFAIGASKEMLSIPAHALILEGRLYEMLQDISSAWQGRDEIGCKIALNPDEGFLVTTESRFSQARYSLKFEDFQYDCSVNKTSPARGPEETRIAGDVKNRQIIAITESRDKSIGSKIELDEDGFATEEVDKIKKEKKMVTTSKKSRKRDKMDIVSDDGTIIKWNGHPSSLNIQAGNKKNFLKNALVTILRCPKANEYYKAVTGIDFSQLIRNRDE